MNHGADHSRDHTYTTTPFDSNYQDKKVSSQSDLKVLTLLRLDKEVIMEMLKEHIATNSRQPLRVVCMRDPMSHPLGKRLPLRLVN